MEISQVEVEEATEAAEAVGVDSTTNKGETEVIRPDPEVNIQYISGIQINGYLLYQTLENEIPFYKTGMEQPNLLEGPLIRT